MDMIGLQCAGCGSTNVTFDPKNRMLICNQCGKVEHYSRATLNANKKVVYSKENAFSFFFNRDFEMAKHFAVDILNVSKDNAAALYIMAYYEEFVQKKQGLMKKFFNEVKDIALEYDEIRDLIKLFSATASQLSEFEFDILTLLALNMQSNEDIVELGNAIDAISPILILKRSSIDYLTEANCDIYKELAEHCNIPKTCFALLKSIVDNPDSPYFNNGFCFKARTKYFYDNYVIRIGEIIKSMRECEMKEKFIKSFEIKKLKFKSDANID